MKLCKHIIMLVMLLTLVSGVVALVPDNVIISTDHRWIEAGATETVVVTVQVINTSSPNDPVLKSSVLVWCEDEQMGKISPSGVQQIKGDSTVITFTFKAGTKSGDAVLHARVTHPDRMDSIENTTIQRVDHAVPANFAELIYPSQAPVEDTVNITVRIADKYGNIVNSLRETDEGRTGESISFRDSDDGDGGFWDGSKYANAISMPVNTSGHAVVEYKLPSRAGENVISVKAPPKVSPSQTFISIKGIGSMAAHISAQLDPPSGTVYANNIDTVHILYTVTDSKGNPIKGARIIQTSSLGESAIYTANDEGQILTSYGPKSSIGKVTITGEIEGYSEITVQSIVEFLHTNPVMWELTANPQTLASRDVQNDITASIMAKVMDSLGNPVQNEMVMFEITNTTSTTPLGTGGEPFLETTSATTDADGFAVVRFHPGAFPLVGEPGYNPSATGITTIQAAWQSRVKEIAVTFKNYPYLRVETSVDPMTTSVNDTVNVTVQLIGDGWAMRPKPVDAVLVIDRSGSMGRNNVAPGVSRMQAAKNAAKSFVNKMDPGSDRIGLVSYSYEYSVTVDAGLGSPYSTVTSRIDGLSAEGGTAMREGFRTAIEHMITNSYPGSVHAVILMTDGNWNNGGSPLAIGKGYPSNVSKRDLGVGSPYRGFSSYATDFEEEDYRWYPSLGGTLTGPTTSNEVIYYPDSYDENTGAKTRDRAYTTQNNVYFCTDGQFTNQNMSIYAKDNNIRLYTISFAQNIPTSERDALTTLAESTGGFYRHAPTEADLAKVYAEIAGELKTVAGVDTALNLSFEALDVTYNNETHPLPGNSVFFYQYHEGISTNISSWNTSMNPLPGHVPPYPYTIDQSSEWSQNPPQLTFDVGNISINQTWQTTFTLKVLTPGSISIFGPSSSVQFAGSEGIYSNGLPDMFITAIENMTSLVIDPTALNITITGTSVSEPDIPMDFLKVYWNLNYTGTNPVRQILYYQISEDNILWSGSWIAAGTFVTGGGPLSAEPFAGDIDIRGKSGWIKIKVTAREEMVGGAYDEDFDQIIISPPTSRPCIAIT
jgi:hypothetical protein